MSRLTKRIETKFPRRTLKGIELDECLDVYEDEEFYNCAEKLTHYEDLEEQGRLIELPCKVGDTVWAIFPTWTPMECEVVAIETLTSTVNIETKVVDSDADRIFWPADFGKTVFLTKEEAEETLKRLQGNE